MGMISQAVGEKLFTPVTMGDFVARKKKRDQAPMAPAEVSRGRARRWAALGRRDARRYGALQDYTATHSLLRAQGEAQRGQHNVNEWLLEQSAPVLSGNARIKIQMRKVREDRVQVMSDTTRSARVQSQNLTRIERLDSTLANMEAQLQSNVVKATGLSQMALEALGTWEAYYAQIAAIYTRARANASSQGVSAVAAEIPVMRSVNLVEIDGFDDGDSEGGAPARSGGRK